MPEPSQEPPQRRRPSVDVPPSVLSVLAARLGEAPRVSLREEPARGEEAPLIAPASSERGAFPEGRGSYQVLGEIARGGMGVVLRGHDVDLGRDVAMKVLHKDLAQRPEVVQRFVEEAQIGGQLQHPGIVPVYELGLMADERPYFTMRLVRGRTLAMLLAEREGAGADPRSLGVFEAMCQTVAYAHSRGVIHRDLKPANVMVGAFGEVQVVDWGLAKVIARGDAEGRRATAGGDRTVLETVRSEGAGSAVSLVGSVLGTPSYMPPEQASGRVDQVDERADVFALGAVLCEILTGAPPYRPDSGRTLVQAAAAELDDALGRLEASGADEELVKLARQCLMPAPAARPRHAGILADAVVAWRESRDRRAREAQIEAAEARVRETQERKARRLTLALAATVLLAVLGGGGAWVRSESRRAQEEAAAARREQGLRDEVEKALNESDLAAAREQWPQALAAAERAQAVAQAGGASDELARRVREASAAVTSAAAEARLREQTAQDTARLLQELQLSRNVLAADPQEHPQERENHSFARFPEIFAAHGLDIEGAPVDQLAAQLIQRGMGADVSILLDTWASARRALGDEPGALRLLEIAHAVDPDPVHADLREAAQNGDLEMLRALAAGPIESLSTSTLELLGISLARLRDEPASLGLLERAVALHPDAARLQRLYAECLAPDVNRLRKREARRRARLAITHLWAAVALEPANPLHRFRLGVLHLRLGEHRRAIELLEDIVRDGETEPSIRLALARARFEFDETDARAAELVRELLEEPLSEVLRRSTRGLQVWILFAREETSAAIALQRELLAESPGDQEVVADLCYLLIESGNLETLQNDFEEVRSGWTSGPNNLAWYLSTAMLDRIDDPAVLERIGTWAVELAETSVAQNSADANAWNTLAAARLRAGDRGGAIEAAQRSIELAGGFGTPPDWFVLVAANAELGNVEAASFWWERARPLIDGSLDWHPEFEVLGLATRAAAAMGAPPPARSR